MPRKKQVKAPSSTKGKFRQPTIPRVSSNGDKPHFSLEYLDNKYSLAVCEQREKAAFADTLEKLSKLTWGEIASAPRHGSGHEIITIESIKGAVPPHIFTEERRILAFRFCGRAPMVGYRDARLFYIVWLDRSFYVV